MQSIGHLAQYTSSFVAQLTPNLPGANLTEPHNPKTADQTKEETAGKEETAAEKEKSAKLREAFDEFVGVTFYSQMLKSMRKTVGKPAYFHGGRAEEVFQSQLDQVVAKDFTEKTGSQLTGPMFELFELHRLHGGK